MTLTSAKASGGSEDSSLFLALETFSIENAVWVDVMPVTLLIFSTVLKCFDGLVGLQSDHEVEASGDRSDGFYAADSFELADNVSEFSLSICEDKAS